MKLIFFSEVGERQGRLARSGKKRRGERIMNMRGGREGKKEGTNERTNKRGEKLWEKKRGI